MEKAASRKLILSYLVSSRLSVSEGVSKMWVGRKKKDQYWSSLFSLPDPAHFSFNRRLFWSSALEWHESLEQAIPIRAKVLIIPSTVKLPRIRMQI